MGRCWLKYKMKDIIVKYTYNKNEEFDGSFFTQKDEEILPGQTKLINTGVALEIPQGYEGAVFRSASIIEFEIANLPGTIDSDYRSEIKMIILNNTKEKILIPQGEKIGVLKVNKFVALGWTATPDSAGSDLKCSEDLEIVGWEVIHLHWIPQIQSHLHIQYRGRSGLALKGLRVRYSSDIHKPVVYVYSQEKIKISKGDRIVQAIASNFLRKTTTSFPINYWQPAYTKNVICIDTRIKDCTIEFQIPELLNGKVEILNNPSCGGTCVLRIESFDGACFLENIFAKVFFHENFFTKWEKGELSHSERGAFGSSGLSDLDAGLRNSDKAVR